MNIKRSETNSNGVKKKTDENEFYCENTQRRETEKERVQLGKKI